MNKEQVRNDLLKVCKYYKGGEVPPANMDAEKRNLWHYERVWVECTTNEQDEMLMNVLADYINAGLNTFCENDNVAITLKAILSNRYQQHNYGCGDINEFKKWYTNNYFHTYTHDEL